MTVNALLFDLDGTLLDTAPDLANAVNAVLKNHNKAPLAFDAIKPFISYGSRGMLQIDYDSEEQFEKLREEFFALYLQNIAQQTCLFEGMQQVLDHLLDKAIPWGIVTKKPDFLTKHLLSHFEFSYPPSCVVSGDTLEKTKPHPEPMWHACELLDCDPKTTLFVGDAKDDVDAGNSAGMKTLIAAYGYIPADDDINSWGADGVVEAPIEILKFL